MPDGSQNRGDADETSGDENNELASRLRDAAERAQDAANASPGPLAASPHRAMQRTAENLAAAAEARVSDDEPRCQECGRVLNRSGASDGVEFWKDEANEAAFVIAALRGSCQSILDAVHPILSAYRSEKAHITEEQITEAWAAFDAARQALGDSRKEGHARLVREQREADPPKVECANCHKATATTIVYGMSVCDTCAKAWAESESPPPSPQGVIELALELDGLGNRFAQTSQLLSGLLDADALAEKLAAAGFSPTEAAEVVRVCHGHLKTLNDILAS